MKLILETDCYRSMTKIGLNWLKWEIKIFEIFDTYQEKKINITIKLAILKNPIC